MRELVFGETRGGTADTREIDGLDERIERRHRLDRIGGAETRQEGRDRQRLDPALAQLADRQGAGALAQAAKAAELKVSYPELAALLRVGLKSAEIYLNNEPNSGLLALTARETGPEMARLLPLIGRAKAAQRLRGQTA